MTFFTDSQRDQQKRLKGDRVAQRLLDNRVQSELTATDREFIESVGFFFVASGTNDTIDCSIKCGEPGFVRTLSATEIAWPDYDGNRMYRTLGNLTEQPRVSLLFVDFNNPTQRASRERAMKLRIIGRAIVDETPDMVARFFGARRVVRVEIDYAFPNCPRYLPSMEFRDGSVYSPRPGHEPPIPEWKTRDYIKEVLDDD